MIKTLDDLSGRTLLSVKRINDEQIEILLEGDVEGPRETLVISADHYVGISVRRERQEVVTHFDTVELK